MSDDCYDSDDYGPEDPLDFKEDLVDLEREENVVEDNIPDVWWADDIRSIENPVVREQEIEAAEKLLEEETELLRKYEEGQIDEPTFDHKYQHELRPKMRRAATKSCLESVGLGWDHLGDISEDYDFLTTGDTKMLDLKDRLKERIRELGPEEAQELADKMLEEGEIGKEAHETISRQVRLHRVSSE
jgi:hypothetical protein